MANDKCVGLKSEVKKIFNKDLTNPVLDQIKETIKASVDGTKGLVFDEKCKNGWLLTGTVVLLDADDADNPTSLELKITIDGIGLGQTLKGFSAKSGGKLPGIRKKKLEEDA